MSEKKLAVTVFSFPPDKGNVGTAAYLNVFGSIYRVLKELQSKGYDVGDLPEEEKDLIKLVRLVEDSQHPSITGRIFESSGFLCSSAPV